MSISEICYPILARPADKTFEKIFWHVSNRRKFLPSPYLLIYSE